MRVFISYAREDREQVEVIQTDLDVAGHDVWMDRELSGGQQWWDVILSEIERCDVFVLAASEASLESVACRREWTYALAWRKPVLPVTCRPDVDMEMAPSPLPSINFVSYVEGTKAEAMALLRSVREAKAGPPPETPPEKPPVPLSYVIELKGLVEQEETLDMGAQLVLLHRFEEKLDDLANQARLEKLLLRFKRRPDLLASVLPQVDELLEQLRARGSARVDPDPAEQPTEHVGAPSSAAPGGSPGETAVTEEFIAVLRRHHGLSGYSVAPDISTKRENKIREVFDLDDGESLMASFDITLFGTGGAFLAITSDRLLYSYSGDVHSWALSELSPADVEVAGRTSMADISIGGTKVYWNKADPDASVAMLRDLIEAVGSN